MLGPRHWQLETERKLQEEKIMTDTESTVSYTPEALRKMKDEIEALRFHYLMDVELEAGACPLSEQHFILALSALEQARCYFDMAAMLQSRAVAGVS
jgi:hypothetical protein